MKTFHGLGPDQPTSFGPKTKNYFRLFIDCIVQDAAAMQTSSFHPPLCACLTHFIMRYTDTINVHNYKLIMTLSLT